MIRCHGLPLQLSVSVGVSFRFFAIPPAPHPPISLPTSSYLPIAPNPAFPIPQSAIRNLHSAIHSPHLPIFTPCLRVSVSPRLPINLFKTHTPPFRQDKSLLLP